MQPHAHTLVVILKKAHDAAQKLNYLVILSLTLIFLCKITKVHPEILRPLRIMVIKIMLIK